MTLIKMLKYLPALTLIPTFFTFVTIILINLGGVSNHSILGSTSFRSEENTQFNLVNVIALLPPTTLCY